METLIKDLRQPLILRLDTRTLSRLAICSKKWYKRINNETIWKALLARDFKENQGPNDSAKQSYMDYCIIPDCWDFSIYEKCPQSPEIYLGWEVWTYDIYPKSIVDQKNIDEN